MNRETQRQIILVHYLYYISPVILYYDYLITLPDEIKYIWSQPRSLGSIWFFANRYFNFFANLMLLLVMPLMPHTERACNVYAFLRQLVLVIAQSLIIVFLLIRTYALYGRSRRMLYFLIAVCAGSLGGTMWVFTGQEASPLVGSGCLRAISQKTATRIALPWWANFALDTLVFALTLHRTWSMPRAAYGPRQYDLVHILWRDGAVYFGMMSLAYLVNIMTFYFFPPIAKGSLAGAASAIGVSMASRLLLNLRRFSEHAAQRPLASVPATEPGSPEGALAPDEGPDAPELARGGGRGPEVEEVGRDALGACDARGRGRRREVWAMGVVDGRV